MPESTGRQTLVQSWASVFDAGPTLNQCWIVFWGKGVLMRRQCVVVYGVAILGVSNMVYCYWRLSREVKYGLRTRRMIPQINEITDVGYVEKPNGQFVLNNEHSYNVSYKNIRGQTI